MKKTIAILFLIGTLISCSTSKNISEKGNGVGFRIKTSNPNTPYIYKNGYHNFEIKPFLTVNNKDSIYINELRFNAVHSTTYTEKLMFDKFGKWDKEIRLNNETHPVLVWENRQLFDHKNELYSVAAGGIESMEEIYASIIVFDSKNRDCLSEKHTDRDSLIIYFSNGIKNLKKDKKFYNVYKETVHLSF